MKKGTPRNNAICIDFETGGLDCTKQAVTQVAFISFKIDTFEEINRFECFIKPYGEYKYEDEALKHTGVTFDMIDKGLDIKEVVSKMIELFKEANESSHTKKPFLVGHNILFDIGFLQQIFTFTKQDLSKVLDCKTDFFGNSSPVYMDTLHLSRTKWANDEKMTQFRLDLCCTKAGIDIVDAHSAMNDVVATKSLFIYMLNNLRTGGSSSQESEEARFRTTFQF